jgi:hypothetical protein
MAVAFLVPFVVADQVGLQRDIYVIVYAAAVGGLFLAWARDTRQSLREMFTRRWRLAIGLGIVFAGISAMIATGAEGSSPHPAGIEFISAILWRGIVYGAATAYCCRRSQSCSSSPRSTPAGCAGASADSSP